MPLLLPVPRSSLKVFAASINDLSIWSSFASGPRLVRLFLATHAQVKRKSHPGSFMKLTSPYILIRDCACSS